MPARAIAYPSSIAAINPKYHLKIRPTLNQDLALPRTSQKAQKTARDLLSELIPYRQATKENPQ